MAPKAAPTDAPQGPSKERAKWYYTDRSQWHIGVRDQDYFEVGEDKCIRLWLPWEEIQEGPPDDPLIMLQDGMPIVYYNPEKKIYERRVLKIDDRVNFLYVLPDNHNQTRSAGQVEKNGSQDAVAIRLHQIVDVKERTEAMDIVRNLELEIDDSLNDDTAIVIVHQGHKYEPVGSIESIILLITAPRQHLKEVLDSISEVKPRFMYTQDGHEVAPPKGDDDAPDAVEDTKEGEHHHNRHSLGSIALMDTHAIFDERTPFFDVRFHFRPTGETFQHHVKLKLVPGEVHTEVRGVRKEAESKGKRLTDVDLARLTVVLYDLIDLRKLATTFAPEVLRHRIFRYVTDGPGLKCIVPQDQSFQTVSEQVDVKMKLITEKRVKRELEEADNPHIANVNEVLAEACISSILISVKQMLELETEYFNIVQQSMSAKTIPKIPHRVNLADEPLSPRPQIETSPRPGQGADPPKEKPAEAAPPPPAATDPPPAAEPAAAPSGGPAAAAAAGTEQAAAPPTTADAAEPKPLAVLGQGLAAANTEPAEPAPDAAAQEATAVTDGSQATDGSKAPLLGKDEASAPKENGVHVEKEMEVSAPAVVSDARENQVPCVGCRAQ
eukprot:gnl/TRDRNA2_/TRDRNA2_125174_c0_seq1.p1 gnl/TRDRNA2_/TRDRNA2_125174_c0~~gnl/TRDRNA2_/TRDRNA2_125174_c0_seq1.p1  ORF type:complete len:608 (+),score=120.79 gnl/TRDRNA2_/TRDRNA2_125174_c0_seq1:54-1877(+)